MISKDELASFAKHECPHIVWGYVGESEPSFEIDGDGWNEIIKDLLLNIQEFSCFLGKKVRVVQVKEKFGELRFYWHFEEGGENTSTRLADAALNHVVDEAGHKCNRTCEYCGEFCYGPPRAPNGFWIHKICDKCFRSERKSLQQINDDV